MDFYEKPDLENIRKDREHRAYLHNYYHTRFLVGTVAMILVIIICFFNTRKASEIPTPSQKDYAIARTLTTIEGREAAIDEKYDTAKIIAESIYGKDIISVFEVGYMHSFCVFEALEDGYWIEYCGSLFPKADLVKGSAYLGDNTTPYDIYLLGAEKYDHILVTRYNDLNPVNNVVQTETLYFNDAGIAYMKIDSDGIYHRTHIKAYDADGNETALTNTD